METSSIVLVETSPSHSGYVYRKTVTTFKTFSSQICNVLRQFSTRILYGVTKTSRTLNKTLQ